MGSRFLCVQCPDNQELSGVFGLRPTDAIGILGRIRILGSLCRRQTPHARPSILCSSANSSARRRCRPVVGSLSPPGPITRLANRRSSSTGRDSRSGGWGTGRCCSVKRRGLAASNASTRRSNCSNRSRIPATVGLLSSVCSRPRYCLRAATMTSDGVTWSRDAASRSWECSSGGIRAPTIGETMLLRNADATVMTFAVDNSVQILPRVSRISGSSAPR